MELVRLGKSCSKSLGSVSPLPLLRILRRPLNKTDCGQSRSKSFESVSPLPFMRTHVIEITTRNRKKQQSPTQILSIIFQSSYNQSPETLLKAERLGCLLRESRGLPRSAKMETYSNVHGHYHHRIVVWCVQSGSSSSSPFTFG